MIDYECLVLQGLETGQPLIQVGSLVFIGKYEDTLGTGLIFEKSPGKDIPYCTECIFNLMQMDRYI